MVLFAVSPIYVHISLHFIPFATYVVYVWRDLQEDLGTKDINAYLTDSEMVGSVGGRSGRGRGVVQTYRPSYLHFLFSSASSLSATS